MGHAQMPLSTVQMIYHIMQVLHMGLGLVSVWPRMDGAGAPI